MSYVGAGAPTSPGGPRISGVAALGLQNPSTADEKLFLSELELQRPQEDPGLAELLLWDYKIPAVKMKICFCRS